MTDYDVFISYARVDSERARLIRDKLSAHGLAVFFDTEGIDTGQEFPVVIDGAVKGAKCVLGLWTSEAFTGRWVRIESRIGLDQSKLVAAVLDNTRPEDLPAEFYNVNIENLSDFHGQPNHEGWARILRAIGRRVGRPDLIGAPAPAPSRRPPPPARPPTPPPRDKPASSIGSGMGSGMGMVWVFAALAAAGIGYLVFKDLGGFAPPSEPSEVAASAKPPAASMDDNAVAAAARQGNQARQEQAQAQEELRRWRVCEAGELAACRSYLQDFPAGAYAQQAQGRAVELSRPAPIVAADLSGIWSGYYAQGANRTPFNLELSGQPGAFSGRMSEPATFGDGTSRRLYANVAGRAGADGAVVFTKTYDGTGGVNHSVTYEGRIDASGRTINGVWRISGAGDTFYMERR